MLEIWTENRGMILSAIPTILGATGIWLLLPHRHGSLARRGASLVGSVLTALAIVGLITLWQPSSALVDGVLFYGLALTAIVSAVLTITSRDPIYSALWFAAVVLASAGLFLLCGAQFLAAGTIIVYAGAIIVTFLFVIMLAQSEGRATYDRSARSPDWVSLTGFLMLWSVLFALMSAKTIVGNDPRKSGGEDLRLVPGSELIARHRLLPTHPANVVINRALTETNRLPKADPSKPDSRPAHVAGLGTTLFTDHLVTVELAGALLFVALIGALAIASPKPPIRPTVRVGSNPPPPAS